MITIDNTDAPEGGDVAKIFQTVQYDADNKGVIEFKSRDEWNKFLTSFREASNYLYNEWETDSIGHLPLDEDGNVYTLITPRAKNGDTDLSSYPDDFGFYANVYVTGTQEVRNRCIKAIEFEKRILSIAPAKWRDELTERLKNSSQGRKDASHVWIVVEHTRFLTDFLQQRHDYKEGAGWRPSVQELAEEASKILRNLHNIPNDFWPKSVVSLEEI
jgi:hypothetical protein